MKHLGKRFLSSIFALIMILGLLCTTASAAVQSSAYLDGYRVVITPDSNGAMVISVDVTGVGYMPEIGAKTIYVYYPIMMGSGSIYYEDVITHQGTVGRYYYAKANVYAGNSTGGDERYCNTAIKRAIA